MLLHVMNADDRCVSGVISHLKVANNLQNSSKGHSHLIDSSPEELSCGIDWAISNPVETMLKQRNLKMLPSKYCFYLHLMEFCWTKN